MSANESKTVVHDYSGSAPASVFDAQTISDSTQDSTRELLGPNRQPASRTVCGAPRTASAPSEDRSSTTRGSYRLNHGRLTAELSRQRAQSSSAHSPTYTRIIRVQSNQPLTHWPFRDATPRESLGSVDVSLLTSSPTSLQARSVSDISSSDHDENGSDSGRVSRGSSLVFRPGAMNQVTVNETTDCHHSSRLLRLNGSSSASSTDRPPTPALPNTPLVGRDPTDTRLNEVKTRGVQPTIEEDRIANTNVRDDPFADSQHIRSLAVPNISEVAPWTVMPLNDVPRPAAAPLTRARRLTQSSAGSYDIPEIPRMSSVDLARTANEFLRPSQSNLRGDARRARSPYPRGTRMPGLVRRKPVWDTTWINEAFGRPKIFHVAAGIFVITSINLVSGIAIASAFAVHGITIDAGISSWLILGVAFFLFSGAFLYAVYTYNLEYREKERAELTALRASRARHQGERRDLEGQIELANLEAACLRRNNNASNDALVARVDSQVNRRVAEIMAQGPATPKGSDASTIREFTPRSSSLPGAAARGGRRHITWQAPPPPPPSPANQGKNDD